MTKYLVKIISICAFIVLIPVIIAGVALSAVGSTMHNLTVYAVVAGNKDNTLADFTISIGEKDKESTEIKKNSNEGKFTYQNGTEVIATVKSSVGYDFAGWFNGDKNSYANEEAPLSNKTAYSFPVKSDKLVTAVFKLKHYNVTFEGFLDDDKTPIQIAPRELYYGDKITEESDKPASINGSHFNGWKVKDSGTVATDIANFEESGNIVLVPDWSDRVTINYYIDGQDKPFFSKPYSRDAVSTFTLLDKEDETITNALDALGLNGFKCSAIVGEGGSALTTDSIRTEITDNFDEKYKDKEFKIVVKTEAIKYTVNVTTEYGEGNALALTYDVNKNGEFDVETLQSNFTRDYYSMVGVKVGDAVYNIKGNKLITDGDEVNLADELVKSRTVTSVDAKVVWVCDYDSFVIDFNSLFDGNSRVKVLHYMEGEDSINIMPGNARFTFDDLTGIKLEDNFFDTIYKELKGKQIYNNENQQVTLKKMRVAYIANADSTEIESQMTELTIADVMAIIEANNEEYDFDQDGIKVTYFYSV